MNTHTNPNDEDKKNKKNASEDYLIEQFELHPEEYEHLASLIAESFLNDDITDEMGGTILFDAQTFNLIYGSPIIARDFFVKATYKPTNELVGFLGCIPRPIQMNGQTLNYFVPSWAAVHWKHRKNGLALQMGKKLREIGIQKDADGGFAIHEPDQHGINTSEAVARETNMKLEKFAVIRQFVVRCWDVKRMSAVIKLKWYEKLAFKVLQSIPEHSNPRIRLFKKTDAERMFELMQDHIDQNEVSIIRDHDDFIWYVQQPGVNIVVHVDEQDVVDGFILAWKMNLAGFGKSVPLGWLDLVHTYRLSLNDARDLANYLCITSKNLGWVGLQTPYIPYFDAKPFKKAKFIFYGKQMSIDIFNLKKIDLPKNVKNFYFDWR